MPASKRRRILIAVGVLLTGHLLIGGFVWDVHRGLEAATAAVRRHRDGDTAGISIRFAGFHWRPVFVYAYTVKRDGVLLCDASFNPYDRRVTVSGPPAPAANPAP